MAGPHAHIVSSSRVESSSSSRAHPIQSSRNYRSPFHIKTLGIYRRSSRQNVVARSKDLPLFRGRKNTGGGESIGNGDATPPMHHSDARNSRSARTGLDWKESASARARSAARRERSLPRGPRHRRAAADLEAWRGVDRETAWLAAWSYYCLYTYHIYS